MRKFSLLSLMAALMMLVPFGAGAQQGVQAYVSASGYVIFNAPFYNTGTDGYAFDFENDFVEGRLLNWNTIDADGDSYNWMLSPIGEGYGRNGSDGVVMSYSYSNYAGALNPDNYLVSPQLAITANNHYVTFYGSALDEQYPADHFGLAVSSTGTAGSFTMLQEWTMTSKQGGWHEYSVDLASYVGQEIYIAIRHFNSQDNFCLCIDDIFVGSQNKDPLVNCSISLDGNVVANNVTGISYLLNTDGFANNSAHTTTVTATYQSGNTLSNIKDWTFRSGDNFQGSPTGLQAESNGDAVNLSWTLPMMNSSFVVDELLYDFSDTTMSDLTVIDANGDGLNFYPCTYGGYGSGPCLRSNSWQGQALNTDNFAVLPHLTASSETVLTFVARDADQPGIAPDPEHFGVAVSTTGNTNPADFIMIQEWNSQHAYTDYTVDLSAYAGQQIYVAFRHFNTTGETYYLNIDNIKITNIEAEITRPAKGVVLYANDELIATLNHGEESYTHSVNRYNSEYCIRVIQEGSKTDGTYYALAAPQCATAQLNCVAPTNLSGSFDGNKVQLTWERDIFIDFQDDPQGWTFLDADSDGYTFAIYAAGGMEPNGSVNTTGTNASLASFSYINDYGALTPDNYAFMPLTQILQNASIDFYAAGFDPSYPAETFSFVVASEDGMSIATLGTWTTSNPYQKYTVDLSAYSGQKVFLGFRHHSAVAAYALVIDNITVRNAVWAGTSSVTEIYHIYRSFDGVNYSLIGYADGDATSYDDNAIQNVNQYYKVTAVNTVAGGNHCESNPAMSADGLHDYIHITTDGINEIDGNVRVYPNPTNGIVNINAEGLKNIVVMNTLGQKVFETAENQIDLSQFGTGLFMLRITTEQGSSVQRIMVR
ncbi:MAG: choice-of-anchor J domain-containing protein [Bacteroidales bacterium]|nr:choice-of-anchor J domain-containing protein [Bacteroidales bacterium]